jgi:adenine-specific DNA-methyltransferase
LDLLANARRITVGEKTLAYIRYWGDFPYSPITQFWDDTGISGYTDPKVYAVQTNTKVIERCILMTTDPGDIVLDPTCGSGTAAYCAEKWGRRWITCDTSRVAIAISRQRLMTTIFPYYQLAQPHEGIRSGFVYATTPHITLRSIARGEPPEVETLYDRPQIDKAAIRVSGPFTVEAIPAPSLELYDSSKKAEVVVGTVEYISTLMGAVRKSGIVFPEGKTLKLQNLNAIPSAGFLHAEGITSNREAGSVAISFGPRYGPLGVRQAEEAIRTATVHGYSLLILAGFSIDPAAQSFVQKTPLKLQVQFAHINPDMEIHDLLKQTQGSQLFTVLGEPDIETVQDHSGKYVVKLLGVDIYDPATGKTDQTAGDNIPAWFLDEDYDGYSFNICQAFFPDGATSKNPWDKLENALRGIVDKEKIEHFRGTESLPFELEKHKTIAVKVLDNRGNEVIKIRKLNGTRG